MKNENAIWTEGYSARRANRPASTCPYHDLPQCLDWVQGWLDAHFEIQRLNRPKPRPLPKASGDG
ncbi:MAG: hypothetical protein M3Z21_13920 [Pseudomonadota bacterium]|nr:hypothetical protein [Pseudomonadota bacterium]